MKKYEFTYQTEKITELVKYETDIEPPRVGDFLRLNNFMSEKDEDNIYVVKEIWYMPESPDRVMVFIVVELWKN